MMSCNDEIKGLGLDIYTNSSSTQFSSFLLVSSSPTLFVFSSVPETSVPCGIEYSGDSFDSSHLLIFRIPSRMKKACKLNGTLEKLLMAWLLMKLVLSPWLKRGISNAPA